MGYRRKTTTYTLTWPQGHDMTGLEVSMRGLSVDQMIAMAKAGAELTSLPADLAGMDPKATAAAMGKASDVLGLFGRKLVAWNLEDEDGNPVPATLEGVNDQDLEFILEIITSWMEAVSAVDTPLPMPSPPGVPPGLLASVPMDSLPSSQAS